MSSRLGRSLALQQDRRRQEPGVEPLRPRAHGVGVVGVQPGDTVLALALR